VARADEFELTTARTTIRPWRTRDADVLFDIHRRPDVAKWLGDPTPWSEVDRAHEFIAKCAAVATPAVPMSCVIVPRETGVPVGGVSLLPLPDDPDEVQLGWVLHPDHVGRGWATEAAVAMLAHALASGHQRVWACMWPNNAAAAAVCRRLGMTELGVQVDPWYGTTRDPDTLFFCGFADGVDAGSADDVLGQRRAVRTLPDPDPAAGPAPDTT